MFSMFGELVFCVKIYKENGARNIKREKLLEL